VVLHRVRIDDDGVAKALGTVGWEQVTSARTNILHNGSIDRMCDVSRSLDSIG
jgi:hypothetical protein